MEAGGWNEGGKNRWRYKEGSEEKIVEIELTQGKVALIDAERLEEVGKHRWWAVKASTSVDVWYANAETHYLGKRKKSITGMHAFLFLDILPPRDHIDRNGLNNTRVNMRCGASGINGRNRASKKQHIGVSRREHAFQAQWCDSTGKKHHRDFAFSKYPSIDDAYAAAVACRQENNDRAVTEITTVLQQNDQTKTTTPKPITRISGRKNITVSYKAQKACGVVAYMGVNHSRQTKYFSFSRFNGDMDKVFEAAEEWLKPIRESKNRKRERDE